MDTVRDCIFLSSKITADGDCSHEIKRRLLLGRKVMTNLDSILKSRDITLPAKVHLVKVILFPLVIYGCESWTIKKAECRRIDAFELWCWRRLLESPLDSRESQPVNPKGNRYFLWIFPLNSGNQYSLTIHWKDWYWSWNSNTLATWCKELTQMVGWHHWLSEHEFE